VETWAEPWGFVSPLEKRGYRVRTVSVEHLPEIEEEIEGHRRAGRLDEEFARVRLGWLRFRPPDELPEARCLIVVALPRPQAQALFHRHGRELPLILPPTYVPYEEVNRQVRELLASLVAPAGGRVARTRLPLKLLAARSGLAVYGRNNICYVPGMGSFLQLVAAYSDLPPAADHWGEARMMERCLNCLACRHHCPTGAIPADRFLLRAERCLSFHNERPGTVAFPEWIDPSWHNCLVGCMHCQRVCPEDRPFLDWIEGTEEFSEAETALLLEGVTREQLSPTLEDKLLRLDLLDSLDALPRNLGVFLGDH